MSIDELARKQLFWAKDLPNSIPPSPKKESQRFQVPSIRSLLNQIDYAWHQGIYSLNNSQPEPPEDSKETDGTDDVSATSGSTAGALSESPLSFGSDGSASPLREPTINPPRSHDFWETVLGPFHPSDEKDSILSPQDESDPKPYQCTQCLFRFKKRCNLVSHVNNVHEKLRPYCCSICFRRFARKSNCAKHVCNFSPSIHSLYSIVRNMWNLTFVHGFYFNCR